MQNNTSEWVGKNYGQQDFRRQYLL